ncbi:MAG: gluconokinase [Gloeobacteraceae cyanobacterium ES-bin-316]|nr:gluconokinase [Ferruginibacter sp.]
MGVAGSGKTSVGRLLSEKIRIPFFDGDDFHPLKNKEKMRAGIPLNDDDRQEWLHEMNSVARTQAETGGAIIACSALKQKYRDTLSEEISKPVWIYLEGSYDLVLGRLQKRKDHFMPASLLSSQFEILEVPTASCCIGIEKTPEEIVALIQLYLQQHGG